MKTSFRIKALAARPSAPLRAAVALSVSLFAWPAQANIDLGKIKLPSFLGGGQAKQALDPGMLAGLALSKVLDNELPVRLDAKTVYPTVPAPPGGPFAVTSRIAVTPESLSQPLAAGDYEIPVFAYAMDSSVPKPGVGVAYQLGPMRGKAAQAIATMFYRSRLANANPGLVAATASNIQSGVTYIHLPPACHTAVDQFIPDQRDALTGNYIESLESTYQHIAKYAPFPMPSFPDYLAGMGPRGKMALTAMSQQRTLQQHEQDEERHSELLVVGQESGVYAPVQAEVGPWSERAPGVYLRLKVIGGPLNINTLQLRVLPGAASMPTVQSVFGATVAPSGATTVTEGLVGYSVFAPAQPLSVYPVLTQR